ncbi:hypothetical protein F8M41_023132 [Gigaspora margarita]|uniref:Uncharacterized protein n=1 Tax=Gigaspora margarita TaxID=4874 RepID=A0A8H4B109_GIGMA|nr:hypothetical protein F8M41_023132 [Gigaspora margarita]
MLEVKVEFTNARVLGNEENKSSANGTSIVGNFYYNKKDSNGPYISESCFQKDASKKEIMAFDLNMNPIEDNY